MSSNYNHVDWLIPQRVLFVSLEGVLDHSNFSEVNAEVLQAILEGNTPIHIITDVRDLKTIVVSVRHIIQITAIRHRKIGYVIAVGAKGFIRFIVLAVRLITRVKMENVDSLGEAYQLLWALDETLPRKMQ